MRITITLLYNKKDWHIRAGEKEFFLLHKDEYDSWLLGKLTKKDLIERFGKALPKILKDQGEILMEDGGFLESFSIKRRRKER